MSPRWILRYEASDVWRNAGARARALAQQRTYFERLVRDQQAMLAGPLGDGRHAIALLTCASRAEAERIGARDPAVEAGIYTVNVSHFVAEL